MEPCAADAIRIWGPLERADLPGLYSRVCQALGAAGSRVIVCDVAGIPADGIAVEALCRLQLGARRHGREVRLRNPTSELECVVAFMGLDDVIRCEAPAPERA